MSASLDKKELIFSLTEGVGVQFGRASRRSFFDQLARLEAQPGFRQSSAEEKQFLIDLLAFAAFYQCVVIPIYSSAQFVSVLREAGASHLRVAGDKLDQRHANRALAATTGFRAALEQARVPDYLLNYATLKQFIRSARKAFKERNE